MDTNARKNRSGNAMELILAPFMGETAEEADLKFFAQKKFAVCDMFAMSYLRVVRSESADI